jgi:hypothetical protein
MAYSTSPECLLCIDPGTAHTGWAIFRGFILIAAGHTSYRKILAQLTIFLPPEAHQLGVQVTVVVEVPKKYKYEEHPVGDLITLAFRAGVIVGLQRCPDVVVYDPYSWKGGVPKPVHHARVLSVLTPDEKALLQQAKPAMHKLSPDMLDAVGLGLFHLKRMGRGVRIAGAL